MATNEWDQFKRAGAAPAANDWDQFQKVDAAPEFDAEKLNSRAKINEDMARMADPRTGMPWYEKALVGAGAKAASVQEALTGLADKIGLVPAEKQAEIANLQQQRKEDRDLYQKYHPGGWATAGEVGTDLALSALPVAKGGQVLTQTLGKLGRFAPAVADVAANAGYSAATAPENRGTAAAFGGGGALAGRVLTRALGGAVRPSAQAQELLDQGVRMTPGQAGEGATGQLARLYEDALGAVPVIGSPVRAARQQGLEDWNRAMLRNASAGPQAAQDFGRAAINRTSPIGKAGIDDLASSYRGAYGELFPKGTAMRVTDEGVNALNQDIAKLSVDLPPSLQGKFDELATGIVHRLQQGVPAPLWKETITGDIDAMRKAAYRNGDNSLGRALTELDKKLLQRMESGHISGAPDPRILADVDAGYKQFKVLQKAGERASAIKRGGTLYPSEVAVDAAKRGATDLQQQAIAAQQMFGSAPSELAKLGNLGKAAAVGAVGHGVAGGVAVPAAVLSLLGTTEIGRRFLLGQVPWQAVVRAHPDIAAQVGRALAQQGQPQGGQ